MRILDCPDSMKQDAFFFFKVLRCLKSYEPFVLVQVITFILYLACVAK